LLDTIEEFKFDACIGGARRMKKSRAKERIFSVRDELANGIPNYNVQNYGISIMAGYIKERMYGCFLSATGQSLDIWNYIAKKIFHCHQFIFLMNGR